MTWQSGGGLPRAVSQHALGEDKTEAEFLQGMLYVLGDAATELVTLGVILAFLRWVVEVDAARVGLFLLQRHLWCYFTITVTACVFFLAVFLQHGGADTSFQFAWLSSDDASEAAENASSSNSSSHSLVF